MARDNFSKKTITMLAERVGFLCSNPACKCHTVGPNRQNDKSTRIGKAAHITAAAPGGPRFDPVLSPAQRSSSANGIWVCSNCSDLIDKDQNSYPASLLQTWKTDAEQRMSLQLKSVYTINKGDSLNSPYLEADLIFKSSMRQPESYSDKKPGYLENGVYVVDISNQPIMHWKLGWELSFVIHNNSSYPALNVSVEIDSGDVRTIERTSLPQVNHIKPFESTKLKISFFETLESTHVEADERLRKRIPESFKNITFKIHYFDETRQRYRTLTTITDQTVVNERA